MEYISFKDVNYDKFDYPLSRLSINQEINLKRRLSDIGINEKISLLNDVMFKTMFMDSRRIKYSAKLISIVFGIQFKTVYKHLKLLNPILDKDKVDSKGMEVDYVAELFGSIISIEVNNTDKTARNMNYLDRLESSKILVGKKYEYPQGSFQISINNYTKEGHEDAIEIYGIRNERRNLLTFCKQYMVIYVPNLLKKIYNKEKLNELERYVAIMILTDVRTAKKLARNDEIMKEYIEESKRVESNDEYLYRAYDHFEDAKEYEYLVGREEGLEQGIEQGRAELIQKLYLKGHSVEDISNTLELDVSRVKKAINC